MQDVNIHDIPKIRVDQTPRPAQIELLEFSKASILDNKKFALLDAPVGLGKSTYAVMLMDWFKTNYDRSATFDILTNSKILQEQYTNEFDFMNSLWGKGSYHCEKHQTDCGTGSEWCRLQNDQCNECPYSIAKSKFEMGDVALTNFHLFLTYHIYMPMAWKRSSRVLIIDEAHDFESVLCDFITTKISKALLKRNGFNDQEIISAINLFGSEPENINLQQFISIVSGDFLAIAKSVASRLGKDAEETKSSSATQQLQSLTNNILKWDSLSSQCEKYPDNWILETELIKKTNKQGEPIDQYYEFTAQPVWAYPYLEETVWNKYDYVICMSGTILDKNIFCKMNGIDVNQTSYISLQSPFPKENRPIYYFHNTGKQTYKTKQITWQKQRPVLEKILKKHKKDKGIIHTANYEIMNWVNGLDNNRILSHDSSNRSEILQQHYNSEHPTVLCSPSMTTGVDLKDEFSRHQTILKMPYPNLGSQKIKKRMDTMPEYYNLSTVRDLVQSCGRSVRSINDHASTYILDSCFGDLLARSRKYFPNWFLEAINYVD